MSALLSTSSTAVFCQGVEAFCTQTFRLTSFYLSIRHRSTCCTCWQARTCATTERQCSRSRISGRCHRRRVKRILRSPVSTRSDCIRHLVKKCQKSTLKMCFALVRKLLLTSMESRVFYISIGV